MKVSTIQFICMEIENANGMKLNELVPKVFLQFGAVRSETERTIEVLIKTGALKCLTYRNIEMDRWNAFLIPGDWYARYEQRKVDVI